MHSTAQEPNSSSNVFASFRSRVSNPSVNQPYPRQQFRALAAPCPGLAIGERGSWQRQVSAETRPAPRQSLAQYEPCAQFPRQGSRGFLSTRLGAGVFLGRRAHSPGPLSVHGGDSYRRERLRHTASVEPRLSQGGSKELIVFARSGCAGNASSINARPSDKVGPCAFAQPILYRPHQRKNGSQTSPQAPPSVRRSARRRGGRELS